LRFTDQLRRRIEHNLGRFEPRLLANSALAPAAVVIVVTRARECEDACVLLIRRARGMRRHAGQFGLPGGRVDGAETVAQAALRELHEELCVDLDEQQVLGALDDYPTRSGFLIRPVVAWAADACQPVANAAEVEEVFRVPLAELLSPDLPYFEIGEENEPLMSATLHSLGDRLYAPTAAILYQFREVALHGRATRVAHLRQPVFAWK
jgi:8-oxo-dGTP pyrophosphatase MutT (NUDIX family)